jgi:hypothetical protein
MMPVMSETGVLIGRSLDVLEAEICQGAANLTAAEAEWLLMVAEFDEREGWASHGMRSCAHWLAWRISMNLAAAREKIRVAHAVARFPDYATAMSAGLLTYSKVRAISRVANEDNAGDLLALALAGTSHHVERIVAAYRRTSLLDDDTDTRAHLEREVRTSTDDGMTTITIRLPVEAGKSFIAAIDRFVRRDDLTIAHRTRRADAAIDMAEHAIAHIHHPAGSDARYLATLYLDPNAFTEAHQRATTDTDDGPPPCPAANASATPPSRSPAAQPGGCCAVAAGHGVGDTPAGVSLNTARRMLCDAVLEAVAVDDNGNPIALGAQRTHTITGRMRRLVTLRDQGCRFPGCERAAWVDIHHIIHWADNGPGQSENLLALCRHHHGLMHEGGWNIAGNPDNDVAFINPNGTTHGTTAPLQRGDATSVHAHNRTARDGQCAWTGEPLDLHLCTEILHHNETIHRNRREQRNSN